MVSFCARWDQLRHRQFRHRLGLSFRAPALGVEAASGRHLKHVALPAMIAVEPVDREPVRTVDASTRVDAGDFKLQMTGLARAFADPSVVAAIRAIGDRGVAVVRVQWSGRGGQALSVVWTLVRDAASAANLADRVAAARSKGPPASAHGGCLPSVSAE